MATVSWNTSNYLAISREGGHGCRPTAPIMAPSLLTVRQAAR